ncbi:MAG: hypothetical protein OJF50_006595 [Nitrospira sp.]|nr:hypothetical protein [Nitrospira sp.]
MLHSYAVTDCDGEIHSLLRQIEGVKPSREDPCERGILRCKSDEEVNK